MHLRVLQLAIKGLEASAHCGLCWASLHPLPECRHSPSAGWAALHVQSPSTMGTVALAAVLLFHYLFQAQPWWPYTWPYTAVNRTKLITGASGCFRGVSVEAGTEQRGMEVSLSRWKLSTPWCPSTCSARKVALSTPQEMPGKTTTDSSKCQVLLVLFLARLQPAKPAWLQRGGHLQAQHLPTHTHRHTPCQPMPRLRLFPGRLSPSSLHDMANSV